MQSILGKKVDTVYNVDCAHVLVFPLVRSIGYCGKGGVRNY